MRAVSYTHLLPLRYTAAELKTNGHAPNRADEPIALRNGLVQFLSLIHIWLP